MSEVAKPTAAGPAPGNDSTAVGPAVLARYARPDHGRSLLDLATSVLPYLGLSVLMYFALEVSYLLALALALPAAGFLVRTYIVLHDCGHGSFMRSRPTSSTRARQKTRSARIPAISCSLV